MSRRKRKNPIAYAAPVIASNYGFVCGGLCIGAIAAVVVGSGAGYIKNAEDHKDAEKRKDDAKDDAKKEEKKARRLEKEGAITQSQVDAVNNQITVRQNLSNLEIASEREKTVGVDSYRSQVGLVGDDFDAVLNSLYAEERSLVENTMVTQLQEEQQEVDDNKPPENNTAKIALYSLLGIATIGGVVYYTRNQS